MKNHDKTGKIWIGFYKVSSGKTEITLKEALDEALCFGWIPGLRKSVDKERFINRYTPRKLNSSWSEVNIKRFNELIELGLMQPSGLKAFNENTGI